MSGLQPEGDYDFVVIGAGSGGVRAARMAALKGRRVAIVEESRLGGTCVNVGCIPKKLFVYASHFREEFEDSRGFGWSTQVPDFDWSLLLSNKDAEIERLNSIYRNLLEGAGVDVIEGRAHFLDAHRVSVAKPGSAEDRILEAPAILIATGGTANRPSIPGGELAIVSDQAFHLDSLPKRVAIIGGGYIALEFACIYHGLGVETHVLYRGDLFLRGFDKDVRAGLADRLQKRGIDVRFDARVSSIERCDGLRRLHLDDNSHLDADVVLAAIGRSPNTHGLGLEDAGVELGADGAIQIDDHFRTTQPHIYAVGDCVHRMDLTPVALAEAMAMVEIAFGDSPRPLDYERVPSAVFTQPPIATVGLSEESARERYDGIDIYRSEFRPLKGTISGRDETTLVKLVVDSASDRVLGVHMLGPDAPEIIQGMAVALQCDATKAQVDSTIGIHPTTAEELVTLRQPVL